MSTMKTYYTMMSIRGSDWRRQINKSWAVLMGDMVP
jgi:hypothetical protein